MCVCVCLGVCVVCVCVCLRVCVRGCRRSVFYFRSLYSQRVSLRAEEGGVCVDGGRGGRARRGGGSEENTYGCK